MKRSLFRRLLLCLRETFTWSRGARVAAEGKRSTGAGGGGRRRELRSTLTRTARCCPALRGNVSRRSRGSRRSRSEAMDLCEAKSEVKQLLLRVKPAELRSLLGWMRNSDELDELLWDNRTAVLRHISDELRGRLPPDAMLPSETAAHHKMKQCARPTVHVDGFLYDEDQVDSLCEEGTMSRSFCLTCGSYRTAPLEFISHSFSIPELQFLFENVLPDLSGRMLVDVGSRLGAVLYGGHVFSSASQLVGLELSEDFVKLQNDIVQKYQLMDRIQVLHTDVCLQNVLLQKADVLIMNNVFEFFMEPKEQVRAWRFIMTNFRKTGSLLVTVPSLQESLSALQEALQPGWVEELPVDQDPYLGRDTDPDSLRQIHLYRVL